MIFCITGLVYGSGGSDETCHCCVIVDDHTTSPRLILDFPDFIIMINHKETGKMADLRLNHKDYGIPLFGKFHCTFIILLIVMLSDCRK